MVILFLTCAALCIPLPSHAEEVTPSLKGVIHLDQVIGLAIKRNQKIKAAQMKWEAVMERYPQAISLEDPEIGIDTWNIPSDFKVSETRQTLFWVSQRFPFPGKLGLKGDIVSREIEESRLHFEMTRRDVVVDLKKSYFELFYIDKAIKITQKIKDLAAHLAKLGAAGLSLDKTTLNDVLKAQSQLAQLNYDLILLSELRVAEASQINAILDLPPESPVGTPATVKPAPFPYKLEELYKLAEGYQEELRILNQEVEKNRHSLELAKKEYYPDFQVKLRRFQNTNINLNSGYGIFFGLKVPIWAKKNRARVQEAEKNIQAATHAKNERKNVTFAELNRIYFRLENSERLIKLYNESLIPQAERSMEIAETWFKQKKGSFSGLLEAQSVWLNFHLARERAVADYFQKRAELERLVGRDLSMKGPDKPLRRKGANERKIKK